RDRPAHGDDRHPLDCHQEITQRASAIGVEPSPAPVFRRVMDHVAPLAQRGEVAGRVVGRIMVQVRARDKDPRDADDRRHTRARRSRTPSASVAPSAAISVPPAAIAQVEHPPTMRTSAMLAATLGAAEADQLRQFRPSVQSRTKAENQPAIRHPDNGGTLARENAVRRSARCFLPPIAATIGAEGNAKGAA
ncbi:hypothetical protein OY671_009436, partial [Metschnikowia pulcherrima]